jgi:hypothetical protein
VHVVFTTFKPASYHNEHSRKQLLDVIQENVLCAWCALTNIRFLQISEKHVRTAAGGLPILSEMFRRAHQVYGIKTANNSAILGRDRCPKLLRWRACLSCSFTHTPPRTRTSTRIA